MLGPRLAVFDTQPGSAFTLLCEGMTTSEVHVATMLEEGRTRMSPPREVDASQLSVTPFLSLRIGIARASGPPADMQDDAPGMP